jgi:hypothetical protein
MTYLKKQKKKKKKKKKRPNHKPGGMKKYSGFPKEFWLESNPLFSASRF